MVWVLVFDGYGYLAEGIRRHLELVHRQSKGSEEILVETVVTGADAIRVGRSSTPALVLLDLSLPHESGFVLIRRFRREIPQSKVIACSMYDQGWLVARTLAAGGYGYIVKSAGHEEFGRVVRVVLGGGLGVPDSVRTRWTLDLSRQVVMSDAVRPEVLSSEDVRVVFGIVHGVTTAELADHMGCAESEVARRRGVLQTRVGCRTAEEWCRLALACGNMPHSWEESHRSGSA
jgi:DNA-binding NarL/FixJ family response regulator